MKYLMEDDFTDDDFDFEEPTLDEIHFGEDLFEFLMELAKSELNEEFTSNPSLNRHFRRHCMGISNKKSTRQNVYYDFKKSDEYDDYEKVLTRNVANSNLDIIDMHDSKLIIEHFHKLFEGNKTIVFLRSCGFERAGKSFEIAMHSFSNDVTSNYNQNTVSVQIIASANHRTITLYAVDANYLENKFNNICKENNLPTYKINH